MRRFAWVLLTVYGAAVAGEPLVPVMTSDNSNGVVLSVSACSSAFQAFDGKATTNAYALGVNTNSTLVTTAYGVRMLAKKVHTISVRFSEVKRVGGFWLKGYTSTTSVKEDAIMALDLSSDLGGVYSWTLEDERFEDVFDGIYVPLDSVMEGEVFTFTLKEFGVNKSKANPKILALQLYDDTGLEPDDPGGDDDDDPGDGDGDLDVERLANLLERIRRQLEQLIILADVIRQGVLIGALCASWVAGAVTLGMLVDWIRGRGLV